MKKKIILIALIGAILSVIIYINTKKEEINIVALGDGISLGMTPYNIEGYSYNDYLKDYYKEKHILNNYYNYSEFNLTAKELIYEIKENQKITIKNKDIEIQRAINEADILTLCIGMDELSVDKITKNMINAYKKDLEELLNMIKLLNNKKVIVLGLYTMKNEEELNIMKLNAIIKDFSIKNNFIFLDINNMLKEDKYYLDKNSYYINYEGHKRIYEEILNNV